MSTMGSFQSDQLTMGSVGSLGTYFTGHHLRTDKSAFQPPEPGDRILVLVLVIVWGYGYIEPHIGYTE